MTQSSVVAVVLGSIIALTQGCSVPEEVDTTEYGPAQLVYTAYEHPMMPVHLSVPGEGEYLIVPVVNTVTGMHLDQMPSF